MEIIVPPPAALRYFLLGLFAFTLLVALLLTRKPLVHRVLPVLIVSVACLLVNHFAFKPLRFSYGSSGIVDDTFREAITLRWREISDGRLVRGLWNTEYRPVTRTSGTAYSGYRSGFFRLANGTRARVFLEPTSSDALLFTARGETYLYSPQPFEPFLATVELHTGRQVIR